MGEKQDKALSNSPDNIKEIIAQGVHSQELKEKVEEFIQVCKLKDKIVEEIHELSTKENKTTEYLGNLEDELLKLGKDQKEGE